MRKLILNWLFGEENVEKYIELLGKSIELSNGRIKLIKDHMKTLDREKEHINTILKLIEVCEKHEIPKVLPFDELTLQEALQKYTHPTEKGGAE